MGQCYRDFHCTGNCGLEKPQVLRITRQPKTDVCVRAAIESKGTCHMTYVLLISYCPGVCLLSCRCRLSPWMVYGEAGAMAMYSRFRGPTVRTCQVTSTTCFPGFAAQR